MSNGDILQLPTLKFGNLVLGTSGISIPATAPTIDTTNTVPFVEFNFGGKKSYIIQHAINSGSTISTPSGYSPMRYILNLMGTTFTYNGMTFRVRTLSVAGHTYTGSYPSINVGSGYNMYLNQTLNTEAYAVHHGTLKSTVGSKLVGRAGISSRLDVIYMDNPTYWLFLRIQQPDAYMSLNGMNYNGGGSYAGDLRIVYELIGQNQPPTKPTTLTVSGKVAPGSTVKLTSSLSTDAEGQTVYYQFQYTLDGGNSWSTIATATARERDFTIPSSVSSQYIQFRVRAYDQVSYSDFTNSSEYPVVYNTAPSSPTNVYIEGTPTFITKGMQYTVHFIGATDVDLDKLTHYVSYSVDGAKTWTDIGNTPNTSFQWSVPSNLEGTVLFFRVRAYDGSLYSGYRTSPNYTLNNKTVITLDSVDEQVEINEADTILLEGTAKDADANQVVMVYYEVGNSGEMIITSSMSGAEFPYSKELVFKGNSIWDGETKVADKVIPNGVLGEVVLKVFAKDTIGAVSDIITKTLTMRPNQNPTISIDKNAISLGEGSVRDITATAKDVDVNDLKVVVKLRGFDKEYEVDLGTSDGVEELVHTFKVNAYGSNIYFGSDRTKPLNEGKLSSGIHYLEVVAKDNHGAVSDIKTVTVTLVANRKPLVTLNTAPKIIVVTDGKFTFTGNVSDLDTYDMPHLTFGVRINGGEIVNIPIESGGDFNYDYVFGDADVGHKTLVFIANDKKEITSITQEFEIVDEKILFEFKDAVETDLDSQKVNILLGYLMSADAVLKVEMCNNGYDVSPTWEDVTQNIFDNSPYSFTNKVKTADKWGINIRVELVKNLAPTVYIDRIGILFE